MKKILVIAFLFLLIPFLSAVELTYETEYAQGETLIAKVSGNFVDAPTKDNTYFYRDAHVRTPAEYDVKKLADEYYIYVKLPEAQNNYSIVMKEVSYYSGSSVLDDDLTMEFTTTNTTADFSVNPGFVSTAEDFSLEVQNLKDSSITLTSTFDTEIVETTLLSGEIEDLDFEINDLTGLTTLELTDGNFSYEIPVYILGDSSSTTNTTDFEFDPAKIEVSMATESTASTILFLKNNGRDLENITFELSEEIEPYVTLSIDELDELESGKDKKIILDIASDVDEAQLTGQIKANANSEFYTYCSVELNFIKNYIPENETEEPYVPETTKTCAELNGTICETGTECDGESISAKDDFCCLTTCKEIQKSSFGKILGWILILAVLAFVAWFFLRKYRGAGNPVDLLKIARGK